jgi:signal transduction histidine kinase/CheY-like chemotaxis protein
VRRKIVVSLLSLFTIVFIGAVVASWYVSVATRQLRTLVDLHEVEGLRRNLVISVQTVQADLYTTHTPMARKLDAIVANVDELDESAGECASCHHRVEVQDELDDILELIELYKTALSHYITAAANAARIGRIELEAAAVGNQILERTERMSATASDRLDEITQNAAARIDNVRLILLLTVVIATGLGIVVSSYLLRAVTRPIRRLVGATGILASGRLGHRIEDEGASEFGELARHFNAMGAALERSYAGLKEANEDLRREVSERRRAEREREDLQSQLLHAQKMEALGTLSAGIAHEFGNFLQVIQGCVERLHSKAQGESRWELDTIGTAVQRGAELTQRLLMFGSKADSRPVPIDLNERVRHVRTILERTFPKTIEVEIDLDEAILPVEANVAHIEQVLLNLAVNARDAMPEGGRLRIETRPDDGEGSAARAPSGGTAAAGVLLCISDTGQGMDQETVQQVFDPFFTTKAVGVGTGLGLSTVYGIVTGYGGRISCSSDVGRGTIFEIRLPGVQGKAVAVPTEATPEQRLERGSATLLLVDDEVDMLDVMRENLQEHGYGVHTASNGEQAVELFQERLREIDLVILDIGMPGMGGRTCLKKLLEIDPEARVIVSTGYGARSDREEMLDAGARGFLAKPSRIADIVHEIEAVLGA